MLYHSMISRYWFGNSLRPEPAFSCRPRNRLACANEDLWRCRVPMAVLQGEHLGPDCGTRFVRCCTECRPRHSSTGCPPTRSSATLL